MALTTYDGGRTYSGSVAVTSSATTTEIVPAKGMQTGAVYVPTSSQIETLTVYASPDGTNFYAVREQSFETKASDDSANYLVLPVIMTVADVEMMRIPDACFPCVALRFVCGSSDDGPMTILLQQ